MTNKPMLSVERELLEELRNVCGDPDLAAEANAILDKPSVQLHGEPVAYTTVGMLEIAKRLPLTGRIGAKSTKDERWNIPLFLGPTEQPAPVADHTQCEECKGWGYHENHHEGGGTECGECGGSGNATVAVAVAVVKPDVDELAQIIRKVDGSHTLVAGSLAEAILEEVARLIGVKP